MHNKWLSPKFLADSVDGSQDRGTADQFPFELSFAWEVHQRDAEQDREDTLAGKKNHGDAGQQENNAHEILENVRSDPQNRVMVCEPAPVFSLIKVIHREPNQNDRDGN
jgi:hypothetical protein